MHTQTRWVLKVLPNMFVIIRALSCLHTALLTAMDTNVINQVWKAKRPYLLAPRCQDSAASPCLCSCLRSIPPLSGVRAGESFHLSLQLHLSSPFSCLLNLWSNDCFCDFKETRYTLCLDLRTWNVRDHEDFQYSSLFNFLALAYNAYNHFPVIGKIFFPGHSYWVTAKSQPWRTE